MNGLRGNELDVVGLGNALVDVLSHESDAFLARHGLVKGTMHLVDEARAGALYAAMGPGVEISGGSAANTIVGVASLGGRAHYVGKVAADQLGEVFAHDLRAVGVGYATPPATGGPSTGRCLIVVTPDAQRTMNTYLGASVQLGPPDVDGRLIARARILYLEGYLFDPPAAQEAFRVAADLAHGAGRKVALTLSDPFCVERHRASFRDLVENHIDILIANEVEICSLWQVDSFDAALQATRGKCEVAALTRSEKGAVIFADGDVHVVDAAPVDKVVDTTGAGDLFAAGFLYGYATGYSLFDSGRIGAIAAAEVISHIGPRPQVRLADLLPSDLRTPAKKAASR
jgi:sugar/nucleoside kinase (ribokinase family)